MPPSFDRTPDSADPRPTSVSELTARIKGLLEGSFPDVWVAGEISNLSQPQSGHIYFTLKDDDAQIRGVLWRGTASRIPFELEDGLEIICRGHLDVYAPRGSYQLVVEQVQPKGVGALELALRKLRDKLAREGLFDPSRKQPIPSFPKRIAVVTSPTGAAIRDFLQVARRRWQGARVLIVPTRVQGDGASNEISDAIRTVNRLEERIDVLVVTRGGGSLEDLWSFNEEPVVRAIAASEIPVVSAIGHEVDVTLSDLAADRRALTPSEAAELVVPAAEEVLANLRSLAQRMASGVRAKAEASRLRLQSMGERPVLRKPLDRIHDLSRKLDELSLRAARSTRQRQQQWIAHVRAVAGKLESLSPLNVLRRGYSLTTRAADGPPIRNADELAVGDELITRFSQGRATSRIEAVEPGPHAGNNDWMTSNDEAIQ